jgi:hypothetical protein
MKNEDKVRIALGRVLTNVSNYPDGVAHTVLGRRMDGLITAAVKAVMESGAVEQVDTLHMRPLVGRVEVIDGSGRGYMDYEATGVMTSLQDGGKTLKVFIGSHG